VLKRRNDAKNKQKIEAGKAKARVEIEAKEKVKYEVKVVAEKKKEFAEATRVVAELVEKEIAYKVVEEERKKKNADDREGNTHLMDLDFLGISIAGIGV
jgi:hypothetical protein